MRWDRRCIADLVPGDQVVVYLDEDAQAYHFAAYTHTAPTFWRRVPATVVETMEDEGTATADEMTEREGTCIVTLGEPNQWRLRLMIGDRRYTIDAVSGRFFFEVLSPHHPVCIECVEPWPCRENRQEAEAERFAHELDDLCDHCGERIGGKWSSTFFDGVTRRRFHLAQKYRGPDGRRCRDALQAARAQIAGVDL